MRYFPKANFSTSFFSLIFFPRRTHKNVFTAYWLPIYQSKAFGVLYSRQKESCCCDKGMHLFTTLNLYNCPKSCWKFWKTLGSPGEIPDIRCKYVESEGLSLIISWTVFPSQHFIVNARIWFTLIVFFLVFFYIINSTSLWIYSVLPVVSKRLR